MRMLEFRPLTCLAEYSYAAYILQRPVVWSMKTVLHKIDKHFEVHHLPAFRFFVCVMPWIVGVAATYLVDMPFRVHVAPLAQHSSGRTEELQTVEDESEGENEEEESEETSSEETEGTTTDNHDQDEPECQVCDECGQHCTEGRNETRKWAAKWYYDDCWSCRRRKRWW